MAALFLDSEAWGIQSLQVRDPDPPHPVGAVVLTAPADGLRQVLPEENEPAAVH